MNIGFVGLGLMGRPMVRRLIDAGHSVLAYDVSATAFENWENPPSRAADVRDLAGCEVVILMLPNGSIVDDVLFHSGNLAEVARKGILILDMGSSDPEGSKSRARELEAKRIRFADAPVSGGVSGANAGTLTIMVGSSDSLKEEERTLLRTLGDTIFDVGPAGSGHAVKALNNALSAASLLAMAEASGAAHRFGIKPETFVQVINESSGRSFSSEWKYPRFVLPGTFDSGFSLALMAKDVKTAVNLAAGLDLDIPTLRVVGETWEKAHSTLSSNADHTEITRWVDRH